VFSFFLILVFNKLREVRSAPGTTGFRQRRTKDPTKGEYSMIGRKKLVIEPAWCKGCGICAAFCPKQVLEIQKEKVTVKDPEACILCGMCELRCPDYAIYLVNLEE
jgi:2-oxoglutarate ferredoxin oxidoreductase subunit delta